MKYINCNYLYYAEDLDKISKIDKKTNNLSYSLNDIVILRYKNFESIEAGYWEIEKNNLKNYKSLTTEFLIADTDLNAITYYMFNNLYKTSDLLPLLRYENIKELLLVIKSNPFLLRSQKKLAAIFFNNVTLELKYMAENDVKDFLKSDLLKNGFEITDVFNYDELIRFKEKFSYIEKNKKVKEVVDNIWNLNLRLNDMRDLSIAEVVKENNPTLKIRNMLGVFEDRFYTTKDKDEKRKLIGFYKELGDNYFKAYENQMINYQAFSLSKILTYLSLGRINKEIISKANVIHDSHQQGMIDIKEFKKFYYEQLEGFESLLNK